VRRPLLRRRPVRRPLRWRRPVRRGLHHAFRVLRLTTALCRRAARAALPLLRALRAVLLLSRHRLRPRPRLRVASAPSSPVAAHSPAARRRTGAVTMPYRVNAAHVAPVTPKGERAGRYRRAMR